MGGEREERLAALLQEVFELRERGAEVDFDHLCRDDTDLLDELRSAASMSSQLGELHRAAVSRDPFRGLVLCGRYRVDVRLGAGSMGVVYSGVDTDLGRAVAIKFLNASLFVEAEAKARFAREAEVLAAVDDPAVVTVFDRGETESGDPFLVMELLEGAPADALIKSAAERAQEQGGPEELVSTDWIEGVVGVDRGVIGDSYVRAVVEWGVQVADGLEVAHRAGVVHRDVKPSNLFIRSNGRAALVDFGVAARNAEVTISPDNRSPVGTLSYLAPELLSRDRRVEPSPALDVYSLAATLYHLLALRSPYEGSPTEIVAKISRGELAPLSRLRRGLPRDLEAIVDKGMRHAPRARYASAAEMAEDLRAFLDYRPVQARPVGMLTRRWRGLRRSGWARALAVSAAVLLCVLGYNAWAESVVARSVRIFEPARAGLLPSVTVWGVGPKKNRIGDAALRTATGARLDAMVENSGGRNWPRFVRAAFRWDHGDRRGAVDDAERVALILDSATARDIAAQFRSSADLQAAGEFTIQGVAEPESAEDRLLYGYHALRWAADDDALVEVVNILSHESLVERPVVEEFVLPLLVYEAGSRKRSRSSRFEYATMAYDRALQLESKLGYHTALSSHIRAASLIHLHRYLEAATAAESGLELCPKGYSLLLDRAIALRRCGEYDLATESLRRAIDLRPEQVYAPAEIARIEMVRGDYEAARAAIEAVPFPSSRAQRGRARLTASLEFSRVAALLRDARMDEARAAAEIAIAAFEAAGIDESSRDAHGLLVCRAIKNRSGDQLWDELLNYAARDVANPDRIMEVLQGIPLSVAAERRGALENFLDSLHHYFSVAR